MPDNGTQPGLAESFHSSEAFRLLWEGTLKAAEWGIDRADLVSLCDIIVRLTDHRLRLLEARGGSESVAREVRQYHDKAAHLHRWALTTEPDWNRVAEQLQTAGLAEHSAHEE